MLLCGLIIGVGGFAVQILTDDQSGGDNAGAIVGSSMCLLSLPLVVVGGIMALIDYARRPR